MSTWTNGRRQYGPHCEGNVHGGKGDRSLTHAPCCGIIFVPAKRGLFAFLRKPSQHNRSNEFGPSGRRARPPWRVTCTATEGLFV